MPPNRVTSQVPVYLHARVSTGLYEAVAAHAEAHEISLSESVRRLLVSALSGVQLTITDAEGTHIYDISDLEDSAS